MNDDEIVAALAEVLLSLRGPRMAEETANALLPIVHRITAGELRKAADWIWDDLPARSSASAELHARADDLDPATNPPDAAGNAEKVARVRELADKWMHDPARSWNPAYGEDIIRALDGPT